MIAIAMTAALAGHITTAEASMSRSGTKTQCFPTGNCSDRWASGYTATGRIAYTNAGAPGITGDIMEADGSLTAWIRMMDERRDVAAITGEGTVTVDGDAGYEVEVWWRTKPAAPLQLVNTPSSWLGTLRASGSWTPTVLTVRDTVNVGPVPVLVTARAKATIGYSLVASVGNTGVDATFTPSFAADVDADASVDLALASAGIYGDLTLIDAEMPVTGSVRTSNPRAGCPAGPGGDWALDVDATIHSLDGAIGVFARFLGLEYRQPLFSWDGFRATYHVADSAGSFCI